MHKYSLADTGNVPSTRSRRSSSHLLPPLIATVVTVVEPSTRGAIDQAMKTACRSIHASSIAEALGAVREHTATTMLLSPDVARLHPLREIESLVSASPGVTTVAVLAHDSPTACDALLDLGACGVRKAVNLAQRDGWTLLRSIVADTGGEHGRFIRREVLGMTAGLSTDMRHFLAALVRVAPEVTTVRAVAGRFKVEPTTLGSRFLRACLPAPKLYLSMTRLMYASCFLRMPRVSVAATAGALRFSSPQSFGRHVRTTLGMTAGEFRAEMSVEGTISHFRERLIEPYREILSTFKPLSPTLD